MQLEAHFHSHCSGSGLRKITNTFEKFPLLVCPTFLFHYYWKASASGWFWRHLAAKDWCLIGKYAGQRRSWVVLLKFCTELGFLLESWYGSERKKEKNGLQDKGANVNQQNLFKQRKYCKCVCGLSFLLFSVLFCFAFYVCVSHS